MSDTKPPDTIFLQWDGYGSEETTWCTEEVNDSDVEYTGGDVHHTRYLLNKCTQKQPVFRSTTDETLVTCRGCLNRIVERRR